MTGQYGPAAVYIRYAQPPTQARASVEQQQEDLRLLCEQHGWIVPTRYVDLNSASAARPARPARTAFWKAADAARAGRGWNL